MARRRNPRVAVTRLCGRTPTQAEIQRRWRDGGGPGHGHPEPTWAETRNGIPLARPYAHTAAELAAAERAWQEVADVQARLRGEPPPPPVAEPWAKGTCPGCGYRMRCSCPGDPEGGPQ